MRELRALLQNRAGSEHHFHRPGGRPRCEDTWGLRLEYVHFGRRFRYSHGLQLAAGQREAGVRMGLKRVGLGYLANEMINGERVGLAVGAYRP